MRRWRELSVYIAELQLMPIGLLRQRYDIFIQQYILSEQWPERGSDCWRRDWWSRHGRDCHIPCVEILHQDQERPMAGRAMGSGRPTKQGRIRNGLCLEGVPASIHPLSPFFGFHSSHKSLQHHSNRLHSRSHQQSYTDLTNALGATGPSDSPSTFGCWKPFSI